MPRAPIFTMLFSLFALAACERGAWQLETVVSAPQSFVEDRALQAPWQVLARYTSHDKDGARQLVQPERLGVMCSAGGAIFDGHAGEPPNGAICASTIDVDFFVVPADADVDCGARDSGEALDAAAFDALRDGALPLLHATVTPNDDEREGAPLDCASVLERHVELGTDAPVF